MEQIQKNYVLKTMPEKARLLSNAEQARQSGDCPHQL